MTPDENIAPPDLTLDGVLAHWALARPDRTVLEYDRAYDSAPPSMTWARLEGHVRAAASRLEVDHGEVVGVVCDHSPEFHVLVNALWRRGAATLLISRTWGAAVVSDLLRLLRCRRVYADQSPEAWADSPGRWERLPALASSDAPDRRSAGNPDDIAIVATTSGTTDNPKCVPITHRQIRSAYRTCLGIHDLTSVRRAASIFPLNGIGVMGVCFLLPREVGACTRVYRPFSMANIRDTWERLLHDDVGFVYLVPPVVRLLNHLPPPGPRADRILCFCASAPVQEHELRALEAACPVRVFNSYGLTEMTFAVFFGCREPDGLASESIGSPIGIEARLVDADGHDITGPGVGEILLKGPMLTSGYMHNPAATAEAWRGGWLVTGDLGERDGAGRYFIRGRLRDSVVRGGVLLYLHELEHYLRRCPGVVDACAFKGRCLPSGDELCAVVQVSGPTERAALMSWARDNIGRDKVPNALFVWERDLPRNSNGKVMRRTLAEMYQNGELR